MLNFPPPSGWRKPCEVGVPSPQLTDTNPGGVVKSVAGALGFWSVSVPTTPALDRRSTNVVGGAAGAATLIGASRTVAVGFTTSVARVPCGGFSPSVSVMVTVKAGWDGV